MKGYLGFPFLKKKKAQRTQTYGYWGVGSVYVNLREDLIYPHQDHTSSQSPPSFKIKLSFGRTQKWGSRPPKSKQAANLSELLQKYKKIAHQGCWGSLDWESSGMENHIEGAG